MSKELGEFVRSLRRQRGMSQTALARQAHISERTLRYWESGSREAGQWELTNALTALGASSGERWKALALLKTPRGVELAQQWYSASAEGEPLLEALPGMGDLMRAMRSRRGLSQEQMAGALGVSPKTILRWEATRMFPSAENLARSCVLLRAYPEEEAALTARQLQPWGGGHQLTLEECAEQTERLDEYGSWLRTPLH